jgi:hypothetical protein
MAPSGRTAAPCSIVKMHAAAGKLLQFHFLQPVCAYVATEFGSGRSGKETGARDDEEGARRLVFFWDAYAGLTRFYVFPAFMSEGEKRSDDIKPSRNGVFYFDKTIMPS